MPKRCAHGTCKSDSRYPARLEGGVLFWPFPKPKTKPETCLIWIRLCGRPELDPARISRDTYVCSKHFVDGQPTAEHPNPIAAPAPLFQSRKHGPRPNTAAHVLPHPRTVAHALLQLREQRGVCQKLPTQRTRCDEQDTAQVCTPNPNPAQDSAPNPNPAQDSAPQHRGTPNPNPAQDSAPQHSNTPNPNPAQDSAPQHRGTPNPNPAPQHRGTSNPNPAQDSAPQHSNTPNPNPAQDSAPQHSNTPNPNPAQDSAPQHSNTPNPNPAQDSAPQHRYTPNPNPAPQHRGTPNPNPAQDSAPQHRGTEDGSHNHHGNHEEEVKAVKQRLAEQKQEVLNLKMELEAKDGQIQLLGRELNAFTTDTLTPESLNRSHVPGYFHHCTGFTYGQFNSLCEFFKVPNDPIAPQTPIPLTYKMPDNEIHNVPLRSQLLLTLMKLRQNLDHKDLAFRFNIRVQSVVTLMNSWIDYMYDRLGKWPHRDVISQNMPADYKEDFPNTFAILDCTELEIERPSSLKPPQSQTDSSYKSSNTLKSVVACDPRGALMYVSALFTGSLSHTEVFNQCGITELLRRCVQRGYLKVGDGLMADEGFLIEREVQEIGLKLNIPPLARSNLQTPHADVEMTKKIAKHRVHVERAIAKIKKFEIVSGAIPMYRLGNINQIWYVVSMLSNFQPHIIKDG